MALDATDLDNRKPNHTPLPGTAVGSVIVLPISILSWHPCSREFCYNCIVVFIPRFCAVVRTVGSVIWVEAVSFFSARYMVLLSSLLPLDIRTLVLVVLSAIWDNNAARIA